jgi:hypothetical protein
MWMDPGIEMPVRFLDWDLFECKRVAFPSTPVLWFVQEAVETMQRRILLTSQFVFFFKLYFFQASLVQELSRRV